MPRLTKQMAEKLDQEIKAYWQREHEKAAEARREKERKYRFLNCSTKSSPNGSSPKRGKDTKRIS